MPKRNFGNLIAVSYLKMIELFEQLLIKGNDTIFSGH